MTGLTHTKQSTTGSRQTLALGPQQATRLQSGTGRVLVGDGGCRHRRGGFLQAKSQLGRSSYHIYLALIGQGGQLDVGASCLHRFICRQETSSVNQAGWHGSTEHSAAVDTDVFMTVWIGDIFSTLP